MRLALLTVSDTRTAATNEGGRLLRRLVEEAGLTVADEALLPDEPAALQARVAGWARDAIADAAVLTGGTGFSPRDRTPDAIAPLYDRRLPGLRRALSVAVVPGDRRRGDALARRGGRRRAHGGVPAAGLARRPSTSPMRKLIVPELPHLVGQLRAEGPIPSWLRCWLQTPLIDPQQRRIDTLRVSVTDRCNYRCTYCMPDGGVAHGAREETLSFEEIAAVVRLFVRLGVRRVRVTGGEPTVRRELPALVRLLRAIPGLDEIALSTNGHLLEALAAPLRGRGGRSLERQPRFAAPRTVPADHGRRRPGARPGRPRRRRPRRLFGHQDQHRRDRRVQRRRAPRALPVRLVARVGAALHRGDADGGRPHLRAGALPVGRGDPRAHRGLGSRRLASSPTTAAAIAARGPPATSGC